MDGNVGKNTQKVSNQLLRTEFWVIESYFTDKEIFYSY